MTAQAYSHRAKDESLEYRLSLRLGPVHARQRLRIEQESEALVFGQDHHSFHLENWNAGRHWIRGCLWLSGMLKRGQRNSRELRTAHNTFNLPNLPGAFDGLRILHLTDLHVDMDAANLQAVIDQIMPLEYDLCVLTGDYRKQTWGAIEDALAGMKKLRAAIQGRAIAVLGNHDSIRMLPGLEDMGYQVLLNEHCWLERNDEALYIAGVDDAHFYKAHNLHKAGDQIPDGSTTILLSHTPEIWREAGYAGYDVFLCGHTHGGQICLPGGIPMTLDSDCPRSLGRGSWRRNGMQGYTSPGSGTSIVNVRLNCPPEVTIHTLTRGPT